MENGGGQQQRERGRQQRLLGTRPYLRAQFDELTEMPISILSMGMGVCTHSRGRAPTVKRLFVIRSIAAHGSDTRGYGYDPSAAIMQARAQPPAGDGDDGCDRRPLEV